MQRAIGNILILLVVLSFHLGCEKSSKSEEVEGPIKLVQTVPISGSAFDMYVEGGRGYVAQGSDGLTILNLDDPVHPLTVGKVADVDVRAVKVFEGFAYLSDRRSGLMVIKAQDPSSLSVVENFSLVRLEDVAHDFALYQSPVDGKKILYIASHLQGIIGIDVTNPEAPARLEIPSSSPGIAKQVQIQGQRLYVAEYNRGVSVYDLANPLRPVLLGTYFADSKVNRFYIHGNDCYIAALDKGLLIVDFTDPSMPKLIGHLEMPALVKDVIVQGDKALVVNDVSSGDFGVSLIDLTLKDRPRVIATKKTPGAAQSIAYKDGYFFIVDGDAGVIIAKVEGWQ